MARKRQLVLIRLENPDDRLSPAAPLGTPEAFASAVAPFNTATDGGVRGAGGAMTFYGPGVVIEIVPHDGVVRQALVICQTEDFAWPVLFRICRANGWKLQDMESGQMFG